MKLTSILSSLSFLLVCLLFPVSSGRIQVNNFKYVFELFSSCKMNLLISEEIELGRIKLPSKIINYLKSVGPNRYPSFTTKDEKNPTCEVKAITLDCKNKELKVIEIVEEIIHPFFGNCGSKESCTEYKGRFHSIYFLLIGGNLTPQITFDFMSKLMIKEYPNHWLHIQVKPQTADPFDAEVNLKRISYICIRCITAYLPGSDYEFEMWKWKLIYSLDSKDNAEEERNYKNELLSSYDLSKFIKKEEDLKLGMLFWWDYYHLPKWVKHSQELLNFGPRNVLSDLKIRANTWQIFFSDILFPMALGHNGTGEYAKVHNFYRAARGQRLQDLRIPGAPYMTQDDESHFNGLLGRNFEVIFAKGDDYKFMTCSPSSASHISFDFYFGPFESSIWWLILFLIIIQPTLVLLGLSKSHRKVCLAYLISFFSGSLIEISSTIPKVLMKNKTFSAFYLMWALICVILSNGYKGILTNYVLAPLKDSTPKTWDELASLKDFTFWLAEGNIPTSGQLSAEYGILYATESRLAKLLFISMKEQAELIRKTKNIQDKQLATNLVLELSLEGQLFTKNRVIRNFDYAEIEKLISKCDKTVFVETTRIFDNYIKNAFPKRSAKVNRFYTWSEDTFKGGVQWIGASKFGNPRVISRLKQILECGIFGMWREILEHGNRFKSLNLKLNFDFQAQKLVSNIASIFIIYLTLISLCLISFVTEVISTKGWFIKKKVKVERVNTGWELMWATKLPFIMVSE